MRVRLVQNLHLGGSIRDAGSVVEHELAESWIDRGIAVAEPEGEPEAVLLLESAPVVEVHPSPLEPPAPVVEAPKPPIVEHIPKRHRHTR